MLILSAITISLALGCAVLAVALAAQEPESR